MKPAVSLDTNQMYLYLRVIRLENISIAINSPKIEWTGDKDERTYTSTHPVCVCFGSIISNGPELRYYYRNVFEWKFVNHSNESGGEFHRRVGIRKRIKWNRICSWYLPKAKGKRDVRQLSFNTKKNFIEFVRIKSSINRHTFVRFTRLRRLVAFVILFSCSYPCSCSCCSRRPDRAVKNVSF